MNKSSLILQHFQKADQLIVQNPVYRKNITSLFSWLSQSDSVKNDVTTRLLNIKGAATAGIIAKENCVIAGMEEVMFLAGSFAGLKISPDKSDGQTADSGEVIAEISGSIDKILAYERIILNILQRFSGIATQTHKLIHNLKNNSISIFHLPSSIFHLPFIAATRKTPWMLLDKKAVAVGGGLTHRLSLSDGILVKDNHLLYLDQFINRKRQKHLGGGRMDSSEVKESGRLHYKSPTIQAAEIIATQTENDCIEIEVETENQAKEAIKTFLSIRNSNTLAILFDNFIPGNLKKTITLLKKSYDCSKIIFEASGGIEEKNITQWAETGADILSIGSLTHSPRAVNLSLEV